MTCEDNMTITIDLFGRCPSKREIMKEIKNGLRQSDAVQICWGENMLRVDRMNTVSLMSSRNGVRLYGNGWIRRNGGSDIAEALMKEGVA
jgi:hypothetical protein